MRRLGGFAFALAAPAFAAVLQVGPGQTYATPCAAIGAASAGDEVDVAPGTYTDSCAIGVTGMTLRGVGGRPKIDLSGTLDPYQDKGIYVVTAPNVTIDNLELTGSHITDANGANGAGIRVEAPGLTVHGCYIHDNQDGILGGTTGQMTVEYTEFFNNGVGDGCNQGGCTHNIYVANIDSLTFQFNWSHHIATDTSAKGHLFKSRAKVNYLLYNHLIGEAGFDSYEVDLPNGGLAVLVGNQIEKGPMSGNGTMVTWGEEGTTNPDMRIFLVNNTLVDDLGSGTFVNVAAGGVLTQHNDILSGTANVGTVSADNLHGVNPLFVNAAAYDYHLVAGSPAIDQGVNPGFADAFSLTPVFEYVQPVMSVARLSDGTLDIGSFEYGTDAGGASQDAGGPMIDAGGPAMDAGSSGGDAGQDAGSLAGVDGGIGPSAKGGCGCGASGASLAALGAAVAFWLARRGSARG